MNIHKIESQVFEDSEYGEGMEWVLEKYKSMDAYVLTWAPPFIEKELHSWVRVMNPRTLAYIIPWAHKKMEEGITIRIRNIRTNEVIPAEILCR